MERGGGQFNIRHGTDSHRVDIAYHKVIRTLAIVRAIHLPLLLVDIVGPNRVPTAPLQAHAHQADPGEEFCDALVH